jgi:16S rRNA (guanine527-N7)-methyltransferase
MSAADELAVGLAALGCELPAAAQERLLAYLALLQKWNRTYNLTAVREPERMLALHLFDSLAILPWVGDGPLLDVGSGGGLPGIPLAIARPQLAVSLVDTVQKKTTFLRQVAIELGLGNVRVHHARVEEMQGQYAQISSRAFAECERFVGLTRHLLAPGGRWLAMKGVRPDAELAKLPAGVRVLSVTPLSVAGVDAERHLVLLDQE